MEFTCGDETVTVKEGEYVRVPGDTVHRYTVTSEAGESRMGGSTALSLERRATGHRQHRFPGGCSGLKGSA